MLTRPKLNESRIIRPISMHTKPVYEDMLFADYYALTASQPLFFEGTANTEVTFHMYIRKHPFGGQFTIAAGQEILVKWLENWRDIGFTEEDIDYLRHDAKNLSGEAMFDELYLQYIKNDNMRLTIDLLQEGDFVNPDQPFARITGPIWQVIFAEGAFLNVFNSQSVFATRGAHYRNVVGDQYLVDGGLRRALELGGQYTARALNISGFDSTSNVAAGRNFGIPIAGSQMHAFIMFHKTELGGFRVYVRSMTGHALFLIDTYDIEQGVRNAIEACRQEGAILMGVRIDSGDLAEMAKLVRRILDEEGETQAKIMVSSDLTPEYILRLQYKGAPIDSWLVGTHAVAVPALGGVYKIGVVCDDSSVTDYLNQTNINNVKHYREVIKLSGDDVKITIPGTLEFLRFVDKDGYFIGDAIVDVRLGITGNVLQGDLTVVDKNTGETRTFPAGSHFFKPLYRVFENGDRIANVFTREEARKNCAYNMQALKPEHKRLYVTVEEPDGSETVISEEPVPYFAGIEQSLFNKRQQMIAERRSSHE